MSTTVAEPKKIQTLRERVAKHTADAEAEQAELVRLTDERRKLMSLRNPRGRRIVAQLKATERRLRTARERQERAETALEDAQRAQLKIVTTPEFTVRAGVSTVAFPECQLELERRDHGRITVWAQDTPCSRIKLGIIYRDGTGWSATPYKRRAAGGYETTSDQFVGDHFPTRTGKHTQVYALAYLVARAAGISSSAATYELKYEGVSA